MSRDLADLHPIVRAKAEAFVAETRERSGLVLIVTHTYRSIEEQAALYALGRDANGTVVDPGKVVTNARPGTSPHNFRLAFDVVPMRDGRAWYEAPDALWRSLYAIAEKVGLDALGDRWGAYLSWDKGHFEEPGAATLMRAGLGGEA